MTTRLNLTKTTNNSQRQIMKTLGLVLKSTIAFLFAVCLSLNLLIGNALAAGQFSNTCTDTSVSESFGQVTLSAVCEKKDGSYVKTSILLNPYIGNDGKGNLIWTTDNRILNCFDFGVSGDGLVNATCFNLTQRNSDDVSSSIDLDDHIANIDGQLQYE
ncbi:CVNH domain-containing protein [Nostoc sp. CENA67]|uniref:CVNH domain-containing protein n=1 Tax=Amazonocrinis nigriterrae CENA67 TaxID=2794033 RepID=A0A8J7HUB2_9NOST|nr:CVNH domain-containing protein [Amazonocrinis nigriterrae]MBH8566096.1 CVNH domain-containing protein [Amazonocrinis nigriterrae CENA67]